ncbi:MAG: agmatinase [Candidatus Eremiobacteraeota bacterium]|nr:agmatinase [Candidatus Eremiobacteraeota bacterium]
MKTNYPDNFCGLTEEFSNYENSRIVILPVPFDETTSWIKGSDKGPQAIIDASRQLELYDIETKTEVYRHGIFTTDEIIARGSPDMIGKVYENVKKFLDDGKFVVTIGGEHPVCIGSIKAHSEKFPGMYVLQLDAHTDMRDSYEGSMYSHASTMSRVKEIVPGIISVGIRSMDITEVERVNPENIFYAHDIVKSENWIRPVIDKLPDNVYITIDVDVFDPGIMPSTGTPEPGGLDWHQVIDLMAEIAEKKNITGFDVTELCPSDNRAPDFLAAKLIYKILTYKFSP